jgi:hypothetical protein
MMEAARTSETSVDIELRTRQYIPEDSELHTRHLENLKSHMSSEMFLRVVSKKLIDVSDVITSSIIRSMSKAGDGKEGKEIE